LGVTFVSSPISFGVYTFPAGFVLAEQDLEYTIESIKVPRRWIEHSGASWPGARRIKISGTIGGEGAVDSSGNPITSFDASEAELNRMLQAVYRPLTPGPQEFSLLSGPLQPLTVGQADGRIIMAQIKDHKVSYLEGSWRKAIQVELDFEAPDPCWMDATDTVLSETIASGSTVSKTWTVTLLGSAKAWPVFYFGNGSNVTGTLTAKVTYNQLPGSPHISVSLAANNQGAFLISSEPRARGAYMAYTGSSPTADTYSDSLTGNLSFVNTVGDGEFFPYLLPGSQTVEMDGVTGPSYLLSVTYRQRYWF
jgi:hypothetical protein